MRRGSERQKGGDCLACRHEAEAVEEAAKKKKKKKTMPTMKTKKMENWWTSQKGRKKVLVCLEGARNYFPPSALPI